MSDIIVTVSRDSEGNALVVLSDLAGNTLAGATFPPEHWYSLKSALAVVEDQMLRRGWLQSQDFAAQLPAEGGAGWN